MSRRAGTVITDRNKATRDHPWVRSPAGVMSCEEIRFWIKALMQDFGWPGEGLSRALGFYDRGTMVGKLAGRWVYPGEQIRASRQIMRILSGELVPVKVKGRGSKPRCEAMVADKPVPLQIPHRMRFDLKSGRLVWVPKRGLPEPSLPSWGKALENARPWGPTE